MFKGYVSYLVDAETKEKISAVMDLTEQSYPKDYPYIPMCPLAAVGETLSKMTKNDTERFYGDEIYIAIMDLSRQTIEIYDVRKMNYELYLEKIAG